MLYTLWKDEIFHEIYKNKECKVCSPLKVNIEVTSLRLHISTTCLPCYKTHTTWAFSSFWGEHVQHTYNTSMLANWVTQKQCLSTRYRSLLGKQGQHELRRLPDTSTCDHQLESNSCLRSQIIYLLYNNEGELESTGRLDFLCSGDSM